jgi:hypothetical protein
MFVALVAVTFAGACSSSAGPSPSPLTALGLVITTTGPDSATVDTFTLRTNQGQTIDFTVGTLDLSDGGLPAPHLREHQVAGTPTLVYYVVQDGKDVAIKYYDALALPSNLPS